MCSLSLVPVYSIVTVIGTGSNSRKVGCGSRPIVVLRHVKPKKCISGPVAKKLWSYEAQRFLSISYAFSIQELEWSHFSLQCRTFIWSTGRTITCLCLTARQHRIGQRRSPHHLLYRGLFSALVNQRYSHSHTHYNKSIRTRSKSIKSQHNSNRDI